MSKQTESPSAGAKPRNHEAFGKLLKAVRAYGWEGNKTETVALALEALLEKPSLSLVKLADLAREA